MEGDRFGRSGSSVSAVSAARSIDHYLLGKTLGIGSFGKVKLAVHKETAIKVAVKVLNKKKVQALDMNDKVWREINVLRLFSHPHIIRL
mmetsp:Transcript_1285/g.3455  ORF Transcript_1285/g.3455 Transcript_1285/m.3455 type:complete len:89 (-) Transcript_1285:254-520(-)